MGGWGGGQIAKVNAIRWGQVQICAGGRLACASAAAAACVCVCVCLQVSLDQLMAGSLLNPEYVSLSALTGAFLRYYQPLCAPVRTSVCAVVMLLRSDWLLVQFWWSGPLRID